MFRKLTALIIFGLIVLSSIAQAVTIINCQPCTIASTTNESCPRPTGLQLGQLLVASFTQTGNNGMTTPAGWTNPAGGSNGICGQSISNGPNFIYVVYKKATATEVSGSSYSFTFGAGFAGGGAICAYDFVGYSAGNPIDGNNVNCNSNGFSASTTPTTNNINTGSNGERIIVIYDASNSSGASTITGPGGATQRISTHDGTNQNYWVGDFFQATAGNTGTQAGSQTQNVQWNALIFGILTGPPAGGSNPYLWPFP